MKEDVTCEPVAMESEDFLFLLYTSGSTGKPKGLVHSQAGYLLYTAITHKVKMSEYIISEISENFTEDKQDHVASFQLQQVLLFLCERGESV